MNNLMIALQFLTIFPVKLKLPVKNKDFGKSLLYFPVAGLLIGLLLSLSAVFFSFLPSLLHGAIILLISVGITGGIHLDGFADTIDAFYGNRPKEEILRIMRDSRIGAMGTLGLIVLLLLKFSLFVSLPGVIIWKALIIMAVFARWSQSLACYVSKYAREEGKAKYFINYARRKDVVIGGIVTLCLFLLLMRLKGLILFIFSLALTFLLLRYLEKRIGGMTGDTIGAVSEFSEAVVLLGSLFC